MFFVWLCFALLGFALLCNALLCFALLCFGLLCFALLWIALLCFALLCFALLCFEVRGTLLWGPGNPGAVAEDGEPGPNYGRDQSWITLASSKNPFRQSLIGEKRTKKR